MAGKKQVVRGTPLALVTWCHIRF